MNKRLRKVLRELLYNGLKGVTELSYLLPKGRGNTPALVYHRVAPLRYRKAFSYANVFPENFDKQMAFLSDNFKTLTVSSFLDRARQGKISGDEVCVTFDDGFRDNYIYALPILKKYGVKATFFLATAAIGTERVFPWMAIDEGAKRDMAENLNRWLPLSWDEVREMREEGMEFGTHTHTHSRSLSRMSDEEAWKELRESTRLFADKLGFPPEVFSYPHGTSKDYNSAHVNMLKSLNYRGALATNIGRNALDQDLFHLKRLIVYEEDSLREVKKKVYGAYDVVEGMQRIWLRFAGSVPVTEQMEGGSHKKAAERH